MRKNIVLAGAIAAALGLVSGLAMAAPATPFTQEINATTATSGAAALTTGVSNLTAQKLGFGVSAGQSVYLRFNLSGDGATFTAVPVLSFATAATSVTVVSGGAASSFVIFQVTAPSGGYTPTSTYTLKVNATGVSVTATSAPVVANYAEYANAPDAANQTGALSTLSNLPVLSFAKALSVAGSAASPLKIDVASNNAKFVGGVTVSPIGKVNIRISTTAPLNLAGTAIAMADLVDATAAKTTLTVTGNFSAAPKNTAGTALLPGSVFLGSASTCGTVVTPADTLTAGQAVFKIGPNAENALVCYKVSGTTPISGGSYTATYAPTGNTSPAPGYILPSSVAMTLGTLTTNGITATVLNIPSASNSDQPYIRIYNTSTLAGPIRGTLYAQSGTVLYNGVLISSLAPGAVQVLTAANLETLAGTTWTGRAYLSIFGQIPTMKVQSLIRDANGTLVNVSSAVQ